MDRVGRVASEVSAGVRLPSKTPSVELRSVEDVDQDQEFQKTRMVVKLFALFPPQPDVELRVESWLEELRGLPWRWVSRALAQLTSEDRVFCPSCSEVKVAVAKLVHAERRRSDPEYNARAATSEGHAEEQLQFLRRRLSAELERGIMPPGVSARDALGSQQADTSLVPFGEGWDDPTEPAL